MFSAAVAISGCDKFLSKETFINDLSSKYFNNSPVLYNVTKILKRSANNEFIILPLLGLKGGACWL